MISTFDENLGVLLDEQGLMVPPSELEDLKKQIDIMLAHTDDELVAIGMRTVASEFPHLVRQFNPDYFKR